MAASARGVVAAQLLGTSGEFAAGLERRGFGLAATLDDAGDRRGAAATVSLAIDRIGAALAGEVVDLAAVPIDIEDRSAWDRLVLEGVRAIPWGQVASYGEVARRIGRPGAARAVGGAVGRNPVGLLVPCHRVIAADGTLGGYGAAEWGGVETALRLKRSLLALEGIRIP